MQDEVRAWLLDIERRVTRLETREDEFDLRRSKFPIWLGIVASAGTAVLVFLLNVAAHNAGWL